MVKRILAWIVAAVGLCLCMTPAVYAVSTTEAKEPVRVSAEGSIALSYTYAGYGFSDVEITLYRVADVSADYQYTYTNAFSGCSLPLNGISSQQEWDTVRNTLESYCAAHGVKPDYTGKTDKDGKVTFDKLKPGLYFVPSARFGSEGFRYYYASTLIALPGLDGQTGKWNYNVAANLKSDITVSDDEEGEQYTVYKVWKDRDNLEGRPKSIVVDILRNGKTVRQVTLSDANNWTYSWTAEKDNSIWTVTERNIPKGYLMSLDKYNTVFILTNYIPDPVYPDIPEEKPLPPGSSPKTGDTLSTGFYLMLMCISGAVLMVLGLVGARKAD